MSNITQKIIEHVAKLANIPISKQEAQDLTTAFQETLEVVDNLKQISVEEVEPTHQVTGLSNVTRPDKIEKEFMFSQKEALANAKDTYQGYFVVPRILKK